jgi:glycerol-3-phosphate dehydrogenase
MNRGELLSRLRSTNLWDLLVIGGGATGLGVALEAQSRGYRTLLLEQADFCKGTSSKSTKLIHGGVRYLEQGNLTLVFDALRERGFLLQNASGIVRPQSFIIPCYKPWDKAYYGFGLKLYELLAGRHRIQASRRITAEEVLKSVPALEVRGLRGGVLYFDAQFDDARLAIALARTCSSFGGTLLNYTPVRGLLRSGIRVSGVQAEDVLTGEEFEVEARVVVNCTGVFSDGIRALASDTKRLLSVSRGSHLVLHGSVLGESQAGLLIPRTADKRVLFAIPWHGKVLAGTTDVADANVELEPRPSEAEIEFILAQLGRHLNKPPSTDDISSVFAGLRPLIGSKSSASTASLSRDHQVVISETGLVSVVGGKWTTYRKMGEDAVNRASAEAGLPARESITKDLKLCDKPARRAARLSGSSRIVPAAGERLHPSADYAELDVTRAVREEWACTVEDVLARRSRLLLLDARASIEVAPRVASLMAASLGKDKKWEEDQVTRFERLAKNYLPGS